LEECTSVFAAVVQKVMEAKTEFCHSRVLPDWPWWAEPISSSQCEQAAPVCRVWGGEGAGWRQEKSCQCGWEQVCSARETLLPGQLHLLE